jgi:hypothetical protein
VQLRAELGKIRKNIEARFGEMFYDNLLWRKVWKDAGTSTLLSLGWQLSTFRIYGGAFHDISAMGQKFLKGEKVHQKDVTDRILFFGWYSVLNAAEAAVTPTFPINCSTEGRIASRNCETWCS